MHKNICIQLLLLNKKAFKEYLKMYDKENELLFDDQNFKRVSVKILGENYVLKTKSSEEYTNMLANALDLKMRKLAKENPQLSPYKIAVLTSMNLIDEREKLNKEIKQLLEVIDKV